MCAILASGLPAAFAAEEEEAGNNLSVPVLWSEEEYLPPITMPVTEQFTGEVLPGHVVAQDSTSAACMGAVQQDFGNVWQAPAVLQAGGAVTTVDWGDNLEAMDPNLSRAYTRVEVGLAQTLATPSTGYDMCWISGKGMQELWGAQVTGGSGNYSAVTSERTEALVYTAGARLTIQRIVPGRDYSWDASAMRWQGTGTDAPYFNGALHEAASDGPGAFGAEITISGRMSYGYLWPTNSIPQGEYRLTFSLDGAAGDFPGSGTNLSTASLAVSEEEGDESEGDVSTMAEGAGNAAVMRNDINLTYIDVTVGTRTDPIPTDEPTAPPSGGSSSGGSTPTPVTTPGPGPAAGPQGPIEVAVPIAATALVQQNARIRARKSGKYPVGQTLLLAARPVYTDAGVTVRWRERVLDRDRCTVRVRDGRATVTLNKPGTCTVFAWAPAPSPDYAPFRWSRTYRAVS
jgi:hypothetical protein